MIQPRVVRWTVGVPAVLLFAFAAREFPALAVLVIVVCGLAGLAFLVMRNRGMAPLQAEQERDKHDRFLRDIPPPSNGPAP